MYCFLSRLVDAPRFTFYGSHGYVTKDELAMVRSLVGVSDTDVTKKIEDAYAKLLGDGLVVLSQRHLYQR